MPTFDVKDERELNAKIQKLIEAIARNYAFGIQRRAKDILHTPRIIDGKTRTTTYTGHLASSIQVRKDGEGYKVSATAPYAEEVEYGAKPKLVNIEDLKRWARIKLGNEKLAYPIQKKIARKGTPAQPYLEPATLEMLKPSVDSSIKEVFG